MDTGLGFGDALRNGIRITEYRLRKILVCMGMTLDGNCNMIRHSALEYGLRKVWLLVVKPHLIATVLLSGKMQISLCRVRIPAHQGGQVCPPYMTEYLTLYPLIAKSFAKQSIPQFFTFHSSLFTHLCGTATSTLRKVYETMP